MFHKRHTVGARPGTLVIPEGAPKPVIRVMDYTTNRVDEREIHDPGELEPYLQTESVTWIDIQGLGDERLLRDLATLFPLHPLLLEDVVNIPQRPKSETFGTQHLIIGRMVRITDDEGLIREQVSICIGATYVVTFQERYGDIFDVVRARIRAGRGAIRQSGADYLAYALIDTTIDGYYPVIEKIGDALDELEDVVVSTPTEQILQQIFRIKRQLLELRRGIWPQRESLNSIVRDDHALIREETRIFFRDTYDHCVQVIDVLETYRELAGSLLDVYMSSMSNRMNEIMKVLTIMASIFIPITFVAGVYGMNFESMPELHSRYAYPIVLGSMAGVAGVMIYFFKRQGWIGRRRRE